MPTKEVTDATFEREVLQAERSVLVDFWATWCAPCRAVAPILEELSDTYADHLIIAKLDVDASPMTASRFGIRSIPTLVLFEGGRPKKAAQGALPKAALIELLEANVASLQAPSIDAKALAQRFDAGEPTVVFDLRDPRDVSRSHLRRARPVAEDALADALAEVPPGSTVVLVCRTGEQSGDVAKRHAGRSVPVVALAEGILGWEGSGLPTYSDREEAELDA